MHVCKWSCVLTVFRIDLLLLLHTLSLSLTLSVAIAIAIAISFANRIQYLAKNSMGSIYAEEIESSQKGATTTVEEESGNANAY